MERIAVLRNPDPGPQERPVTRQMDKPAERQVDLLSMKKNSRIKQKSLISLIYCQTDALTE